MGLPPTSTKISGDSNPVTTFNFEFPNFTGTHTGVKVVLNVNGIAGGGTGVTSVTTSPTASAFAGWDANKNFSADSFISGYATTATAASTTTLTVDSVQQQYFTGVTTQTVVLPVTSTLVLGQQFTIVNLSTGIVTVNSSGGNLVQSVAAGTAVTVTCILTSGTSAASWSVQLVSVSGTLSTFNIPNVTASGSYNTLTFTGLGTPGSNLNFGRQNGDMLEYYGTVVPGTVPGSTLFSLILPSGLTIDYAKLATTTNNGYVGSMYGQTSAANIPAVGHGPFAIFADGSTTDRLFVAYETVSSGTIRFNKNNSNLFTSDSTTPLTYKFSVPISQWTATTAYTVGTPPTTNQTANTVYAGPTSGGAAASSFRALVQADLPQNTIVFAYSSTAKNLPSSTATVVVYDTVVTDTSSAYNSSTGVFTAPAGGGIYLVLATDLLIPGGVWTGGQLAELRGYRNGSIYIYMNRWMAQVAITGAGYQVGLSGSMIVPCVAGDTISVAEYQNQGATATTNNSSPSSTTLSIIKIGN